MGGRAVSPAPARLRAAAAGTGGGQSVQPDPADESSTTTGGRRIGVLGGTFDPPHIGHLWLATLAADTLGLGRVLLMPAARPPHKGGQPVSNAADRVMMTRLAIAGDPLLDLSLIEMERPGPSYTVDSLLELRATLGEEAGLVLIMAADSLAEIDTWRDPDRLLELAEWAIGPRPGTPVPDRGALRERFGASESRIHLLEGPSLDVSSTEIRRRVAAGRSIRYLVPRAVAELIAERDLYRRA